ncbi:16S rRNA (guanine(966)-N(2))-methyltransferase RsmD [Enemella dayhoffiae]|uniref:16S rRNA (Guanine(966)-N(2))-methyltransferase RsmD n=1 Tax=Enemella dayhoffiae TaxID=2016507 RepID=A0A255GVP2_9ACTN|nr:16S rRNA (guanine(966)-N(2))-methyltransferase RsmD [Enemella dayhoffiae]OYO17304.1 16S rRNA (guanine(966)-N(2))-methyltransferase RsmD [Enemella dayhoffiae]
MSRIITGTARGRRLLTPDHQRTRPTSDRVREALFSALVSWADGQDQPSDEALRGFSLLDLYAGTGAIGLEAASRGAGPVVLVEADRSTADLARRNATDTELAVTVRTAKVETFLAAPALHAFDIVWLDPPYDAPADKLDQVLTALVAGGWLARHGLVVVERSSRGADPTWPPGVGDGWERRYGETTLHFAVDLGDDRQASGAEQETAQR